MGRRRRAVLQSAAWHQACKGRGRTHLRCSRLQRGTNAGALRATLTASSRGRNRPTCLSCSPASSSSCSTSRPRRRCRLHGGASGSGGPPGKRNGQYRHGENQGRDCGAAEVQRVAQDASRCGHEYVKSGACAGIIEGQAARRLDSERFRSTPRTCGRFRGILSLR